MVKQVKVMLKQLFFLILFVFYCLESQAQTRMVKGRVMNSKNKEALFGVAIGNYNTGTSSDENGYFQLHVDTSIRFLQFKLIGFQDTIIPLKNQSELDVFMNETSYLLNTSVITASRFERPLAESSISMSVIKSDLPEKLNTNSVEQILDRVPGVQLIDGQANIRGGSGYSYGAGSRVLLMMDELPAYVSDAGFPNWDDLPIENIAQIEIVKGAASALYGSSAMNGIIHFRSALPGSEPFTSFSINSRYYLKPSNENAWWDKSGNESMPYEAFINFVHRKKIRSYDYSISGQYYNRIGYNKDTDSKTGRIHGILRKRINDRFKISLAFNFNKGYSTSFFYWKDNGLFEGDTSSVSKTDKLRFTIDPSLTYDSKSGYRHKLLTRYFHVYNGAENNQSNQSENVYAEYQVSKTIESMALQCIGGVVLNQSWTDAQLYSDTSFYHRNIAGFLQLEKKWFDRLILSAGMRYEKYDIHGPYLAGGKPVSSRVSQDTFIFRFGANLKLASSSFLRASIGQGFRFPTIAEKYISTTAGGLKVVPNPNLQAEYGLSYEIGVKQALQFSTTKVLLDLALFGSRYHDMMEFLLNNQLQFQSKNIGDTDIKGLEIEAQSITETGRFTITTTGGYTFIDPVYLEFDLSGKKLPINDRENASRGQQNGANSSSDVNILKYRSKHLFRYDLQINYRKLYFGMNFNYASNVQAIDWLFELSLFLKGVRDYRIAHSTGYRVYDFRIGYQGSRFNLQFNVHNAFNEDYTLRPGLMEAPRNLSLRFTYKL